MKTLYHSFSSFFKENGSNTGIDGTPNHNSLEDVAAKTWVGQEVAVKGIINELAILAHTGPYRVLTRVNYVAYTCYFNGVYDNDPKELLEKTAVDMVGFSLYSTINTDIKVLTAGRTDNNIPHIAESSSGIYSAPAKMIYAATDACGVLQYELFYTNGYSTETSCVFNRDGTYRDGSEGGNVTTELIGINRMFASIGDIMAVSAYENMTSFNLNQEREIQQSANLGGYEIGFTVNDSGPYGGVGLAVYDKNEHIYLYSSKAASFTVANAESAGVGYYSDDDWIEVRSANGTLALTDDEAQNGYIIRVTLNK